jgi:hypothetical protein
MIMITQRQQRPWRPAHGAGSGPGPGASGLTVRLRLPRPGRRPSQARPVDWPGPGVPGRLQPATRSRTEAAAAPPRPPPARPAAARGPGTLTVTVRVTGTSPARAERDGAVTRPGTATGQASVPQH